MAGTEYIAPWEKLPANFGQASNVDKRILLARRMRSSALASRVVLREILVQTYVDIDHVNSEISSHVSDVINGHLTQAEADPHLAKLYEKLALLSNIRKAYERQEKLCNVVIRKNDRLIKRLLPRSDTLEAQEAPGHHQAS